MKLVELLAKELAVWADTTTCYVQDRDGTAWPCEITPKFDGTQWGADNFIDQRDQAEMIEGELSSDYATAIVTKAQWQAERDRQKGGEWKRHRGKTDVAPVGEAELIEVRFRSGKKEIDTGYPRWIHNGGERDIMAYRVISQPQAEEVEMNKFCTGEKCSATSENIVHSQQCQLEHEMAYTGFKIDQIDGPIRWRDTINELDAYIEEFTRERESLVNRLALEGFALLPAMHPVVGVADLDMSDWRNWQEGDIVEVAIKNDCGFTIGKQYPVSQIEKPGYEGGMPVMIKDEDGCEYWPEDSEYSLRPVFKFIRRP